ncbi:DNA polymerase Y family protein [Sphingobium sp. DEHP117]|nr:DNA polymerase Y family protein [Sphingobium sp. DEHP117]
MRGGLARPEQPFALVEKQRGALRLAALSPLAAQTGIAPGMALADARGLVPDLATLAHDPEADAVLLGQMARHCIAYTPSVMPDPPCGIMLDITGCAHLFGGEAAMRDAIAQDFRQRGYTMWLAVAHTPDAARALARHGGADVHALPLDALDVDETVRLALRRAGIRTIGELAALPPATLAARFGAPLVRLLARLTGSEDPHIVPHLPPEDIRAELRFAEPIGRHADVLDAIEWLATQAAGALAESGKGGRAFAVQLCRSDGHVARLSIETGTPTRDPALLMRLFAERIDSLADPLDPGFGYDSLVFEVSHAETLEQQQRSLAPDAAGPADIGPLLDRLAVRYGPAAIQSFATGNSHVPERAGYLARAQDGERGSTSIPGETGEPPLRPLFLLDPPQPVEVLATIPDGPPRRFRWRGEQHLVRLYEGPERIAPEWWRRRQGYASPGFSRDYYRIEDEDGRRFWLCRHGLHGRETSEPRWYVHGLFA